MPDTSNAPQSPGAQPAGKSLGMGAETTEPVSAEQQEAGPGQAPDPATGQQDATTGRRDQAGVDRAGSEPLERTREHVPSYGGMAGAPRTSSDQREPADPEGDANVARGEGGSPPTAPRGAHGHPGGQADDSDPADPSPS